MITIPGPTVTVTASGSQTSPGTSGSTSNSTSSTSHLSNSTSSSSISIPTTPSNASSATGDFITTTYLTYEGTSLVTVTAIVSNPGAHVQSNSGKSNDFLSNRTAVIGVFTAIAIITFAMIVAFIAWAARRRTLKIRQREEEERESKTRRNFFDDEDNDVIAPSEKSWWGNASGTSIPDMSQGHNEPPPPVPPLPFDYSPSAPTFSPSIASSAPLVTSPTSGASVPHPYASAAPSVVSDSYQIEGAGHHHNNSFATTTTASREAIRSPLPPPTSPTFAHKIQPAAATTMLPLIKEGASSRSSDDWNSNIQHMQSPSGLDIRGSPSPTADHTQKAPSSALKASEHPYASPRPDRRSKLFADDVLLGLGGAEGLGRSLSDSHPAEPVVHSNQRHQHNQQHSATHSYAWQTSQSPPPVSRPVLQHSKASNGTGTGSMSYGPMQSRSDTGFSDGRWFEEDSSAEAAKVRGGAAASGESVLEGNIARNNGFRLGSNNHSTRGNGKWVSNAHDNIAVDVSERKRVPHDPRFSGLFGNVWGTPNDESQSHNRMAYTSRQSTGIDLESIDQDVQDYQDYHDKHGENGRVLRVSFEI